MTTFAARTLTFLSLVFAIPAGALACSCASTGTACSALQATPMVFAGRVTRDTGPDWGTRNGVMIVEEVLHGLDKGISEVEVDTMAGTSCHMPLKKGERYVIYGSRDPKNPKLIHYHACSFSFQLRGQEVLMDALRAAQTGAPSRLIGQVEKRTDLIGIESAGAGSGIKIIAEREGQRVETATFGNGSFEFRGISPGIWKLTAQSPGLIYEPANDWPKVELQIPVNGCASRSLTMVADGHIRGTVRDKLGNPVEGVPVEVFGYETYMKDFDSKPDATVLSKADGTYDFGALSPREYIIGINGKKYSDDQPSPPAFAGGTSDRKKAARIPLKEKEFRAGIDLVLPEKRQEAVLLLRLEYGDGTLAKARGLDGPQDSQESGVMGVRLLDLDGNIRSEGRAPRNITDGNVAVPMWLGETYSVEAWRFESSLLPRGQGVGVAIQEWEGTAGPIKMLESKMELRVVLKPKTSRP